MGWLNNWLINVVGEDKAKWLKGVLAWFLLTLISNLMLPLTEIVTGLSIPAVWISYILIAMNSGSMVIGAMIIIFIGKPIVPQLPEAEETPAPEEATEVTEPVSEPAIEPVADTTVTPTP